jgi:hypothetical protein
MNRKRFQLLLLPIILVALVLACSSDKGDGPENPPDNPDPTGGNLIWIDSVDAAPGSDVSVNVYARIETSTQGLTVPLIFDNSRCYVDSISTAGTILDVQPQWKLDTIASRIAVVSRAYDSGDLVQPDSGLFFRVYVSLHPTITIGNVEIDTTTFERDNGSVLSLVLADNTVPVPKSYVPEFHPGVIRVTN